MFKLPALSPKTAPNTNNADRSIVKGRAGKMLLPDRIIIFTSAVLRVIQLSKSSLRYLQNYSMNILNTEQGIFYLFVYEGGHYTP